MFMLRILSVQLRRRGNGKIGGRGLEMAPATSAIAAAVAETQALGFGE
jgi:hypothetical protein